MSLGYGWQANLLLDDNDTAAYSYHTYDLSLPPEEDGYDMLEDDGMIWVYAGDAEAWNLIWRRKANTAAEAGFTPPKTFSIDASSA